MKNLKVKSVLFGMLVLCLLTTITSLSSCNSEDCEEDCISVTASPLYTAEGLQVQFRPVNIDTSADCEMIGEIAWDYGDGTIGNEASHQYSVAGTYDVCISAAAVSGGNTLCSDTDCISITVRGGSI